VNKNDSSRSDGGVEEVQPLERVAAELTAGLAQPHEETVELPPALAARLIAIGEAQVRAAASRRAQVIGAGLGAAAVGATAGAAPRARWVPYAGWMLAAAAMLAWVMLPSPFSRAGTAGAPTTVAVLDALLKEPDVIRVPWALSTDPAGSAATGEVVWDARTQRGVLRIAGLAPNDPRIAQYQLWIIDAARDARYPVDGGVFDVSKDGEVLVPITARLRVQDPTLFAVTLERPGGVVVSARERLVLAAQVKG